MRVVRMVQPTAGALPEVRRLFELALRHGALDPQVSINRLCAAATDPRFGLFIGLDPTPKALMIVILPPDPRTDRPLVDIGTNIGGKELGSKVLQAGMAFMKAAGYNTAWTFNFSGRNDAAYIRAFRRYGVNAKPRATMMEFDF